MIIKLPTRISATTLAIASGALFVGQLATGTDPLFAAGILVFFVMSGVAFNLLGGMTQVSGFCIAMLALKIVLISQLAKICFDQPSNSYLDVPRMTAAVLALGMISIVFATWTITRVRATNPVIKPIGDERLLRFTAIVALVLGIVTNALVQIFGFDQTSGEIAVGGFLGISRQLSVVLSLAVVAGTAHAIVASGGRRTLTWLVILAGLTQFGFGVLRTDKEAMFLPVFAWVVTCIAFKQPFRWTHIATLVVGFFVAVKILFPFAQVGREITRDINFTTSLSLTRDFISRLTDPDEFERIQTRLELEQQPRFQYYGTDVGLLERFSLIQQDDQLIAATLEQGTSGWVTITHGFEMLVPRFLYANKPIYNTANYLGHRIGETAESDEATQISFGIIAESFSAFGWAGVLVIPAILMLCFCAIYRKLVGPLDFNIWTVFMICMLQHWFVEATIASLIQDTVLFVALWLVLYFVIQMIYRATSPVVGQPAAFATARVIGDAAR